MNRRQFLGMRGAAAHAEHRPNGGRGIALYPCVCGAGLLSGAGRGSPKLQRFDELVGMGRG